jgi:hypothetical protein
MPLIVKIGERTMPIMITLPTDVEKGLQAKAEAQQVSLNELIVDILIQAVETELVDDFPTLEEVVAEIKATPPNPASIHPPTASLADLLREAPTDPNFDLEAWQQEWDKIEAEMKAITRANEIAEGRG